MENDESFINEVTVIPVRDNQDLTKAIRNEKQEYAKYWDRSYINEKIALVKDFKKQMFLRFLWYSGVRVSEAVGLRKCDIKFEYYTMEIRWLKSRKYKTRIVPLHPRLKDMLFIFTAGMKYDELVFPFSRQRAWQVTTKYMGGSPHRLRHSFAVNWLRCGGDIVTLHRMLGHSKLQVTMEYLKIVPQDQGKELLKINFE